MSSPPGAWQASLARAYDLYFASDFYDSRYPAPNASTLAFLWRHGAHRARRVLDVGCGNGRYALALLARGSGHVVGCDISKAALAAFEARLHGLPERARVDLVLGDVRSLPSQASFDCLLMLFGVLGHIGPRPERVAALRALRECAAPNARLLLSVPSVWRRLPGALLRSFARRLTGQPSAGPDAWADVEYQRVIQGDPVRFHYHLYRVATLRAELAEAGWWLAAVEAESVLPEKWVCASAWVARVDRWLQRGVPAGLGYGIRGVARLAPGGD